MVLASGTRSLDQYVISAKLCAMSFVHSFYTWCKYMVGLTDAVTHTPLPPAALLAAHPHLRTAFYPTSKYLLVPA